MQRWRLVSRAACHARNAYDPTLALRSAFSTSHRYHRSEFNDALSSAVDDVLGNDPESPEPPKIFRTAGGVITRFPGRPKTDSRREKWTEPDSTRRDLCRRDDKSAGRSKDQFGYSALRWREEIINVRKKIMQSGPRTEEFQAQLKSMGDYTPRAVRPISPEGLAPIYPWAVPMNDSTNKLNGTELLSEEIRLFAEWIQSTPAELAARKAAITEIIDTILQAPNIDSSKLSLELFGSSANGLALPLSDIDLRIHNHATPNMPNRFMAPTIRRLRDHIRQDPRYDDIQTHGEAYPMLEFRHMATGIHVQLVAGHCAQPQVEVVKRLTSEIPTLQPLFHLLRVALDMRGLVEVFYGGIGSYGLFVALAAAISPGPRRHTSLAEQLRYFLNFYGFELNTNLRALTLSTRAGAQFFSKVSNIETAKFAELSKAAAESGDAVGAGQWKMCRRQEAMPWLLCLQDPANPGNDLGKKCYAVKHIFKTFQTMWAELRIRIEVRDQLLKRRVIPRDPKVLLKCVVGNCAGVYRRKRERLEEVGRALMEGKTMEDVVEGLRERGAMGSQRSVCSGPYHDAVVKRLDLGQEGGVKVTDGGAQEVTGGRMGGRTGSIVRNRDVSPGARRLKLKGRGEVTNESIGTEVSTKTGTEMEEKLERESVEKWRQVMKEEGMITVDAAAKDGNEA